MLRQDWHVRAMLEEDAPKFHTEELLETITGQKIGGALDMRGKKKIERIARPSRQRASRSVYGQWLRPDQFFGVPQDSRAIAFPLHHEQPQQFDQALPLPPQYTPSMITNPWPEPHTHFHQKNFPPRNVLPHQSPLQFRCRPDGLHLYSPTTGESDFPTRMPIPLQAQPTPGADTIHGVPILRPAPRARRGKRVTKGHGVPRADAVSGGVGRGGTAVSAWVASETQGGSDETEGFSHRLQHGKAYEQRRDRLQSLWEQGEKGRRVSGQSNKTI